MKPTRPALLLTLLLAALSAAWAWQARTRPAPPSLAAMLPQGALLTIESPDFTALLADWCQSPQAHAWLASDNYKVFSNSRLFGRLNDAQSEFFAAAFAAKATPDSPTLLTQVAGKQSIFAWYNIGNLEFLYVTRMPSAQSLRSALLQQRARFQQRQAAGLTFYIRTSKDSPARTVAFATVPSPDGKGDLLLLATREDLLAQSLTLIAGGAPAQALIAEPWYAEAATALPAQDPTLHMVLNLQRLVPMAYFRSYWIQQNISEMSRYRTAVTNLYREPGDFREERVLLANDTPEPEPPQDLAALAAISPANGVFRATATQDPATAVAAIEEKLLGRQQKSSQIAEQAPEASLDPTASGSASDLETRIDTAEPVSAVYSSQALAELLKTTHLNALLTYSSAAQPTPSAPLWVPIHNAVVLESTSPWDALKLQSALQQALRGTLTTATLGIEFHPAAGNTFALTGPRPLFLAVRANRAYLADDQPLLESFLHAPAPAPATSNATLIAGFNHTAQRAPYARLTSLIDGTNNAPAAAETNPDNPKTPAWFSQNIRSLSDSFAALQSERFTQSTSGQTTHQTVLYQWHP